MILDTLISTSRNCHFVETTTIGCEWSEVIWWVIELGSGCMLVGRSYVSWGGGRGSSCSCCLRRFGRRSLVVYQWGLGLVGEMGNFLLVVNLKWKLRIFFYRLWHQIRYEISNILVSTSRNCHLVLTTPMGYDWSKVICWGLGMGNGCLLVGRTYVSWFGGRFSMCSCCLRRFGRRSLVVYQWVLGLAGEEGKFFTFF